MFPEKYARKLKKNQFEQSNIVEHSQKYINNFTKSANYYDKITKLRPALAHAARQRFFEAHLAKF